MGVLRILGRLGLWTVALCLWLLAAVAVYSGIWFAYFGPEEERMVASIWLIIMLVFGTPALLLTAWLGGFWDRLFPQK